MFYLTWDKKIGKFVLNMDCDNESGTNTQISNLETRIYELETTLKFESKLADDRLKRLEKAILRDVK